MKLAVKLRYILYGLLIFGFLLIPNFRNSEPIIFVLYFISPFFYMFVIEQTDNILVLTKKYRHLVKTGKDKSFYIYRKNKINYISFQTLEKLYRFQVGKKIKNQFILCLIIQIGVYCLLIALLVYF